MSLAVVWEHGARHMLTMLPWRDAARVDAAVQVFAATGAGKVTRSKDDAAVTVRLHVPPYRVRLDLDRAGRTLHVSAVYRLR